MSGLSQGVRYAGKDEALPERRELRAGPLAVVLEGGDLRYVRFGEREVLRRVYVAVRDRNWDTILPNLTNLQVESSERSFRVSFDCEHKQGNIDFTWHGAISGQEDGTIVYTMDGIARSTFQRNRIGICILHPARECAGAAFRATKDDGTVENGALPLAIAPHQPSALGSSAWGKASG